MGGGRGIRARSFKKQKYHMNSPTTRIARRFKLGSSFEKDPDTGKY